MHLRPARSRLGEAVRGRAALGSVGGTERFVTARRAYWRLGVYWRRGREAARGSLDGVSGRAAARSGAGTGRGPCVGMRERAGQRPWVPGDAPRPRQRVKALNR